MTNYQLPITNDKWLFLQTSHLSLVICHLASTLRRSNALTNLPMRSVASSIRSSAVAKQQRKYPSPLGPKALPGTQATFSCSSSFTAKSLEVRPVDLMQGNA